MSQEQIWDQIEHLDGKSSSKTVLDVYDDYAGKYACNVPDAPATVKPSPSTKTPFKGLKEK
jgi:hypothetical protein